MSEEPKKTIWQIITGQAATPPEPLKLEEEDMIKPAPVAGAIKIYAPKKPAAGDAAKAVIERAENPLKDDGLSWSDRLRATAAKISKKADDFKQKRADQASAKQADKEAAQAVTDTRQKYLQAIVNGFGEKNIAKAPIEAFVKGDGLNKLIEKTDIESTEAGKTVLMAKDKSYSFTIDEKGVTHNDTDTSISKEEAFLTAELINLNAEALENGVEIVGNDEQKAMYLAAMEKFAPDVPIKNQAELDNIPQAIKDAAKAKFTTPPGGGGPGGPPPPSA